MEALLQRCEEQHIVLNTSKEKLVVKARELPYMGHVFSSDGLKPDPGKVHVWDGTFWAGSEFVPEVFPFSSAARLCQPLGPRPEYTLWLRPEYTLWRTVQVQLAPGRSVSYLFRLFEGKRQCEQRVGGELESWKRLNGETVGELL